MHQDVLIHAILQVDVYWQLATFCLCVSLTDLHDAIVFFCFELRSGALAIAPFVNRRVVEPLRTILKRRK